jgi:oligopeptide transport system substrate-binding protein
MKKRVLFVIAMLAIIAIPLFAGAEADAGAGQQILRVNISEEPGILDPLQNRSTRTSNVIYALHEPLLRIAPNEQRWEPGLATGFTVSADETVYTFSMRKGAKWSDGSEITAHDVVDTLKTLVDPTFASPNVQEFYNIVNVNEIVEGKAAIDDLGVKALDDYTLEITLDRPVDTFIDSVTSSMFCPIQAAARDEYAGMYGTDVEYIVASGPFIMESWEHDANIVLVKNENYWDAENVQLDRLEISLITDENTVVGMYKTDALDVLDIPKNFLNDYKDTAEFYQMPMAQISIIEFNSSRPFLENIKIREALSIAFNRQEYVEKVLGTGDIPAYGLVPPGMKGLDGGDFREQAGDIVKDMGNDPMALERAKKLLAEGLKELGKSTKDLEDYLQMYCVDSSGGKRLAQAIQEMWLQNLGVNITVVPLQIKMLIPFLIASDFDMVVGGGASANVPDAAPFMDFVYYENKWMDDNFRGLMEKSFDSTGNERIQYLMEAERAILDNFIQIPQKFTISNYVVREYVKDYRRFTTGITYDFKHVSIEK